MKKIGLFLSLFHLVGACGDEGGSPAPQNRAQKMMPDGVQADGTSDGTKEMKPDDPGGSYVEAQNASVDWSDIKGQKASDDWREFFAPKPGGTNLRIERMLTASFIQQGSEHTMTASVVNLGPTASAGATLRLLLQTFRGGGVITEELVATASIPSLPAPGPGLPAGCDPGNLRPSRSGAGFPSLPRHCTQMLLDMPASTFPDMRFRIPAATRVGEHQLRLELVVGNSVVDSKEERIRVAAVGPNLAIRDIDLSPIPVSRGETVRISIDVINIGNREAAAGYTVDTQVGATQLGATQLPDPLPPGGVKSLVVLWQIPLTEPLGAFNVRAEVNGAGDVLASDNVKTAAGRVRLAPPPPPPGARLRVSPGEVVKYDVPKTCLIDMPFGLPCPPFLLITFRLPNVQWLDERSAHIAWKTPREADSCQFFYAKRTRTQTALPTSPNATVVKTGHQRTNAVSGEEISFEWIKSDVGKYGHAEWGHEVSLTGLDPSSYYHYRVTCRVGSTDFELARDSYFRTMGNESDTSLSFVAIGDLFSWNACHWTMRITWPECSYKMQIQLKEHLFEAKRNLRIPFSEWPNESRVGFDFMLGAGDISNGEGYPFDYAAHVFETYNGGWWRGHGTDILKGVPFLAVPGNHDYTSASVPPPFPGSSHGGRWFKEAWDLMLRKNGTGKTYFSFDAGNAHFIGLDVSAGESIPMRGSLFDTGAESYQVGSTNIDENHPDDSAQVRWLKGDLRALREREQRTGRPPWKIVYSHFPLTDGASSVNGPKLIAMLEAAGVDLFIAGHYHVLEYRCAGSVPSLILGSGGASGDSGGGADGVNKAIVNFTLVDVKDDTMRFLVIDTDGESIAEGRLARGSRRVSWSAWTGNRDTAVALPFGASCIQ